MGIHERENIIRLGSLVLRAIVSIPAEPQSKEGFFEKKNVFQSKRSVSYLGYSLSGIKYRDLLQDMANPWSSVLSQCFAHLCHGAERSVVAT